MAMCAKLDKNAPYASCFFVEKKKKPSNLKLDALPKLRKAKVETYRPLIISLVRREIIVKTQEDQIACSWHKSYLTRLFQGTSSLGSHPSSLYITKSLIKSPNP